MKAWAIDLPLHHYTRTGQHRLRQFVSGCGGTYEASVKLDVPFFFIDQVLREQPVPDHILDRIEQEVGPIRLVKRTPGRSNNSSPEKLEDTLEKEAESEITLKEFVRNCGGLLAASFKLGVSTSTIEKVLSEVPLSGPTIKKLLTTFETSPLYTKENNLNLTVFSPVTYDAALVNRRLRYELFHYAQGTESPDR